LKYDPGETDLPSISPQQVTTPVVCERTAKVGFWRFKSYCRRLLFLSSP